MPVAAAYSQCMSHNKGSHNSLRFTNRRRAICGSSHRSEQSNRSGMRMVSFCMWKEGLVAGGDDKATDF